MKFNKKHMTLLAVSFFLLILSMAGISYMEDRLVYQSIEMQTKNEARLLEMLRNLSYNRQNDSNTSSSTDASTEDRMNYKENFYMLYDSPNYQNFDDIKLYFANTSNYKEVFGKFNLQNIDKLKIDPNYKTGYPLGHPKVLELFPQMKNSYPPTIVAVTNNNQIRSYFYIDGRIADFSKVEMSASADLFATMGENQRMVIESRKMVN